MNAELTNISTKNETPKVESVIRAHGLSYSGIAKTLDGVDHMAVKRALDPVKSLTAGWLLVERVRTRTSRLLKAAGYEGDTDKLFPSSIELSRDAA